MSPPPAHDGSTTRPALRVRGLRKAYGAMVALEDLSFAVLPGEIVGLLGPNGAGKTTTINMILGVLEPTAGRVQIDGIDLADGAAPRRWSARISRPSMRRCRAI